MTTQKRHFFCGPFLLFVFHDYLCYAVLSVPCNLVLNCKERKALLALLCFLVFVTSTYGVLGKVRNLIVKIPHLCLSLYL